MPSLPIIDVSPLAGDGPEVIAVARAIDEACRSTGFFYVRGHGVDPELIDALQTESRRFFERPPAEKMAIRMALGGRAWRGYFPVGGELTSGRPDNKEGLYFGRELPADHPDAARPLHGPNLFPAQPPELRRLVLAYQAAMTDLGHRLMGAIALGLGLPRAYFEARYTADPLILFRIFHYPAADAAPAEARWGVGAHTDYGLLTMLEQDRDGGLEVRSAGRWIDAPPIEGTFICNLGDMLDRMTGGLYRSTLHRVRLGPDRLSMPFFFDPNFDAEVRPIEGIDPAPDDAAERWDGRTVRALEGTYGAYLLSKVEKVFPALRDEVL